MEVETTNLSPIDTPSNNSSEEENGNGDTSQPNAKLAKLTSEQPQCSAIIKINIENDRHAQIVATAISVEPEVKPHLVQRTIKVEESTSFTTADIKSLRTSLGNLLELAQLAHQTVTELSPEAILSHKSTKGSQ